MLLSMVETQPDNTERYVSPTRVGVGRAIGRDVVLLSIVYKLAPAEPEEYKQRYVLTKAQATAIAQDLLSMVRDLSDPQ